MNARTYVNVEKKQVETVLALLEEVDERRGLTAIEKFIRLLFTDALDRIDNGW